MNRPPMPAPRGRGISRCNAPQCHRRVWETSFLRNRVSGMEESLEQLSCKLASKEAIIEELKAQLTTKDQTPDTDTTVEQQRGEEASKSEESTIEELKAQLTSKDHIIEQLKRGINTDIEKLKTDITVLTRKQFDYVKEITACKKKIQNQRVSNRNLQLQVDHSNQKQKQAMNLLQLKKEGLCKQLLDLEEGYALLAGNWTSLSQAAAAAGSTTEELQSCIRVAELIAENEKLKNSSALEIQELKVQLENQADAQLRAVAELEEEKERLGSMLSGKQEEVKDLTSLVAEKEMELTKIQGEKMVVLAEIDEDRTIWATRLAKLQTKYMKKDMGKPPEEISTLEQLVISSEQEKMEMAQLLANKEKEKMQIAELLADAEKEKMEMAELLADKEKEKMEMAELLADKEKEKMEIAQLLAGKEKEREGAVKLLAKKQKKIDDVTTFLSGLKEAVRQMTSQIFETAEDALKQRLQKEEIEMADAETIPDNQLEVLSPETPSDPEQSPPPSKRHRVDC